VDQAIAWTISINVSVVAISNPQGRIAKPLKGPLMSRPKIFITKRIPQAGFDLLRGKYELDTFQGDAPIPKRLLMKKVADVAALMSMLTDHIDQEIIDSARNLRIISNHAVGYNNIDVDYATKKGIAVTNTPGVLTDATADLTWALIMAIGRRIVQGDKLMREGKFKGWDPLMLLGADLVGRTLGIIGAGRIGEALMERSVGWKMRILYHEIESRPQLEKKYNAKLVELDELLRESDFVTIHTTLTDKTRHLIGMRELDLMKPSAYLINAARGPIVDEKALVIALREMEIAGAALDVFENEPDMEPGLAELENVVIVPHLGSATLETRNKMAETAALNIINYLNGGRPLSIVNPEVL
jgi:glyoxylate reductase